MIEFLRYKFSHCCTRQFSEVFKWKWVNKRYDVDACSHAKTHCSCERFAFRDRSTHTAHAKTCRSFILIKIRSPQHFSFVWHIDCGTCVLAGVNLCAIRSDYDLIRLPLSDNAKNRMNIPFCFHFAKLSVVSPNSSLGEGSYETNKANDRRSGWNSKVLNCVFLAKNSLKLMKSSFGLGCLFCSFQVG